MTRTQFLGGWLSASLLLLTACGAPPPAAAPSDSPAASAPAAVGDSELSAADGGPGFSGEGWTAAPTVAVGSPEAKKGGAITSDIPDWPENLRRYGTNSNTFLNNILAESLLYETLLDIDENTLEFAARLATHYQISEDQLTFRFRLHPEARWSDGRPVVAQDVVATWKLLMDDTLIDPMSKMVYEKFHEPKALSPKLVEVACKQRDWRNFIDFAGGLSVLPAHEIAGLTGKEYLDKYNYAFTAVSGPYTVAPEDIKDNDSITATRRADYWAVNAPQNVGRYNFDKIRFFVVRDRKQAFEKTCKGELDFHAVYTAEWWVKDIPQREAWKLGHLVRQKVYTQYPKGIQGLAFNMRHPPLDDVHVRQAIALLWNRREAIEKFAFNEYQPLASYFPGEYANPNNKLVEYDPRAATDLLAEAGWRERGPDGILVKDGKRLSLTLAYHTQGMEKYFTSLKESCKAAGVEINLTYMTMETLFKNVEEDRKFEIASMAWGAILFPNPKTEFHSAMADPSGSNNITGLKHADVDRVIAAYDAEFDNSKRTELLRELDGYLFETHHYALAWWNASERLLYWNKFGTPPAVLPKFTDWRAVFRYWWIDPVKVKQLQAARKSQAKISPVPDAEVKTWLNEPNIPANL